MMTIEQCRGARALLDWSAQDLAGHASIGVATVRRFESGSQVATLSIDAMDAAFTAAGITFIAAGEVSQDGGDGVRLSTISPR
jgi:transcriptional regulator with XRE-family HTH domain